MIEILMYYITTYPITFTIVSFILGAITDFVWVKWTKTANDLKPIVAANWSVAIYFFGVLYTLVIIEKNVWQIGAYCVGAWVGTYLTVLKMKKSSGILKVSHDLGRQPLFEIGQAEPIAYIDYHGEVQK